MSGGIAVGFQLEGQPFETLSSYLRSEWEKLVIHALTVIEVLVSKALDP